MFDMRRSAFGGFTELEGKHAVVMGGAGFLGSHICTWLIYSGARVTCIDNMITGNAQNVSHLMGDRSSASSTMTSPTISTFRATSTTS